MDSLLSTVWLVALTVPALALALFLDPKRRWTWALLFLGLLALDDLATILPRFVPALRIAGADWNWSGKIASIVWAALFVALGPLTRAEVGMVLRQRAGSLGPALLATLGLTAASFCIGLAFGGGVFDRETLAFQLTMPGLAEELVYRGVFIGVLHRALPTRGWAPVVVTAVAFGLWHGVGVAEGSFSFDWLSASFPFLGGLAYGWLRERTDSIVFPILAHNLGNTAAFAGSLL